jgi:hypothetical protein
MDRRAGCGGSGSYLFMEGPGPLCLGYADLDHLVFLPAGNAALSRRAKQASRLSAWWSASAAPAGAASGRGSWWGRRPGAG